jgi:hypothetical protein
MPMVFSLQGVSVESDDARATREQLEQLLRRHGIDANLGCGPGGCFPGAIPPPPLSGPVILQGTSAGGAVLGAIGSFLGAVATGLVLGGIVVAVRGRAR